MFIADVKSQAEETPIDTRGTALCKEGPRRTAGVSPRGRPRCLEALSVPALAAQDPRPHPGSPCPPPAVRPEPGRPATDAAGRQSMHRAAHAPTENRALRQTRGHPCRPTLTPAHIHAPCTLLRAHANLWTAHEPRTSVHHGHTCILTHLRAHSHFTHARAQHTRKATQPRTPVHTNENLCALMNTTHLCTRAHTRARACKPTRACSRAREHNARPETALHRAPDCTPQPAPPSTPARSRARRTHACAPRTPLAGQGEGWGTSGGDSTWVALWNCFLSPATDMARAVRCSGAERSAAEGRCGVGRTRLPARTGAARGGCQTAAAERGRCDVRGDAPPPPAPPLAPAPQVPLSPAADPPRAAPPPHGRAGRALPRAPARPSVRGWRRNARVPAVGPPTRESLRTRVRARPVRGPRGGRPAPTRRSEPQARVSPHSPGRPRPRLSSIPGGEGCACPTGNEPEGKKFAEL